MKILQNVQYLFTVKTFPYTRNKSKFPLLITGNTKKPIVNIRFNGKKVNAFLLQPGKRQETSLSSLLFIVLAVLDSEKKQKKE